MNADARKYFEGRRLVIATMHGKEQVIGPLLGEALGVDWFVADGLNTDHFGTFSGEVPRESDPLEAARIKCKTASGLHNCPLAIASEGSFGPHPSMHFVPSDDEIVVLLDLENRLEFKARVISTQTNFSGSLFHSWEAVKDFAGTVLFPSHGLIARQQKDDPEEMIKGIRSWEDLEKYARHFIDRNGAVFIETDMRAMHNPTRMNVIRQATEKLLVSALSACPDCATPGFDVTDVAEGLPCSLCGRPTSSTLAFIYICQKCGCREERKFPRGKQTEDPMYCNWCNP